MLCVAGIAQGQTRPAAVTVFAASSTTDVMTELARMYQARTGTKVVLNFAASSTLARQIEQGAPVEVFFSANPEWMDFLGNKGLLAPGSRRNLVGNRLVLIAPEDARFHVEMNQRFDLSAAFDGKLALGDPEHVPAGIYAKGALESLGWWGRLADRVVPVRSVRIALRLVEMGEAPAGVVYRTDALSSSQVAVLGEFPAASHEAIVYPAAACRDASPAAREFLDYLSGPSALAVFERYGFSPAPQETPSTSPAGGSAAEYAGPIWLSLRVALGCVLVIAIPGTACGWLLARRQFPGKSMLNVLVHLPLVMPPVVTGYLLLVLLGREGLLGSFLRKYLGIELAFTWEGAVLAAMVMSFPLMVRSVRLAMELVDPRLEQAAKTLGTPPARTFLTVTLPLAGPGILAGLVLAFARSLGEFGATIMFCGNIPGKTRTIPLAIYSAFEQTGRGGSVLILGLVSVGLSLAAVVISEYLARRLHKRIGGAG